MSCYYLNNLNKDDGVVILSNHFLDEAQVASVLNVILDGRRDRIHVPQRPGPRRPSPLELTVRDNLQAPSSVRSGTLKNVIHQCSKPPTCLSREAPEIPEPQETIQRDRKETNGFGRAILYERASRG